MVEKDGKNAFMISPAVDSAVNPYQEVAKELKKEYIRNEELYSQLD